MQWYEATMNFAAQFQFQTFLFVKMNGGIVILIVICGSFFCVGNGRAVEKSIHRDVVVYIQSVPAS